MPRSSKRIEQDSVLTGIMPRSGEGDPTACGRAADYIASHGSDAFHLPAVVIGVLQLGPDSTPG